MKLGVRYETAYRYAGPVNFSIHHLRLFPRGDLSLRVHRVKFETNPDARIRFFRDVFDNVVAACTYQKAGRELRFHLELDLAVEKRNPFDFLLSDAALQLPFTYPEELRAVLAPFMQSEESETPEVPCWKPPRADSPRPTVPSLVSLNECLHQCIGYERREEGPARPPNETLRLGRGACRDVAVLLAAILRQCGLAARLTSGYLREGESESRRAEGSLHAWAEVYLPGAGWVGMDATNGIFANHNFITAAVGMTPAEVTPIDGRFFPPQNANPQMTSHLELVSL